MRRLRTKRFCEVIVAVALLGPVAGCAPAYDTPEAAAQNACGALGPKAMSGALIGGLGGAAGGAALGAIGGGGRGAAIGAGAGLVAGLLVGTLGGNMADRADCREAQAALQRLSFAPAGTPVAWRNPASGSHGAFTPAGPESTAGGRVCRPVNADYYMKGHAPVVGDTGLVCRAPNGDWAHVTTT